VAPVSPLLHATVWLDGTRPANLYPGPNVIKLLLSVNYGFS
jgi:hypothetical protein